MSNYVKLTVHTSDAEAAEIAMAELSDWPFDSFEENGDCLNAYIRKPDYEKNRAEIENFLTANKYRYETGLIEDQNWNELWESNFTPISVENRCMIRAPFHPRNETYEYDIEIMPKMSFGTGHHATTYLMAAEIMANDLNGKSGLDMGSGTGVLAILAVKAGARQMDAVDIDEWAYTNSMENIEKNGVEKQITPIQGDASLLEGKWYDFVLANINRNILLADMPAYVKTLCPQGILIVSGILEADIPAITQKAESLGLTPEGIRKKDGWAALKFIKY